MRTEGNICDSHADRLMPGEEHFLDRANLPQCACLSLSFERQRPGYACEICCLCDHDMLKVPLLWLCRKANWRCLSSLASTGASNSSPLVLNLCGAGTGVGKTILSAGLARANVQKGGHVQFIKPFQSGYPNDDDCKFVLRYAGAVDEQRRESEARAKKKGTLRGTTLIKLSEPASPDLAARLDGLSSFVTDDRRVREMITMELEEMVKENETDAVGIVEGAGGVLSPAPSGTPQADFFRPLRYPCVLVGDPQLGGVSNTLAALETLELRGYDVPAVVFFESMCRLRENAATVSRLIADRSISVFSAPALPDPSVSLENYYSDLEGNLFFANMLSFLKEWHQHKLEELREMSQDALSIFWYPFTQHSSFKSDKDASSEYEKSVITAIDSAYGNNFTAWNDRHGLHSVVDAVGSWWTNGVGHGQVDVARDIGSAAGRYGHVMFAEAAHRPAWKLARTMLNGPGKGWASRVFYTDNGSTAIEVSLKMAFRKRAQDMPSRAHMPVGIASLNGCYHGDTLGAMNCAPPSDYNAKQTPWYESRALVFDPPTCCIANGVWSVMPSSDVHKHKPSLALELTSLVFQDLTSVLAPSRQGDCYDAIVNSKIDEFERQNEIDIGALLIEPVVQGAGGMCLIDPAFQRALVRVCRSRKIPVVFDEVFTGFWRLGSQTAADILGVCPDIASYSKFLTGGTVPLAVTLTTEDVFESFSGASKREALLHGHSYTAHAIGCAAALRSLALYSDAPSLKNAESGLANFWDEGEARELSCMPGVEGVTVIGTVLSVQLSAEEGADTGYAATTCVNITRRLLEEGVFARPLGSVIYVLCTPMTTRQECSLIFSRLSKVLESELDSAQLENV